MTSPSFLSINPDLAWRDYGGEIFIQHCKTRQFYSIGGLASIVWNLVAEEQKSFLGSSSDNIINICKGIQSEEAIIEIVDSLIELGLILRRRDNHGR